MIGPFDMPDPDDPRTWRVLHRDKPKLYGVALRDCGGTGLPDGVSTDSGPSHVAPNANESVPFNFHGRPPALYQELDHSYGLAGFIDLIACDGVLAMHAVRSTGFRLASWRGS